MRQWLTIQLSQFHLHTRIGCGLDGANCRFEQGRAVEILTATDRGTFIFWGTAKKGARAK